MGRHGDENSITDYVKGQGEEYQKSHEDRQLSIFQSKPPIPGGLRRGSSFKVGGILFIKKDYLRSSPGFFTAFNVL
jgi:hypothetical protein